MSHTAASVPQTLPADLQQLDEEFTAIEADVEALVAGLDDEQFNWSPAHGRWSIAQCLEHLNVMNGIYLDAIHAAVTRARAQELRRQGPITSAWAGRRFIASLEPPVRMRTRSPKPGRPAMRRHKAEVWPEFVRVHGRVHALLRESADVDLNVARFRNPFIGIVWMRAGTALRILAAHDRRHVWQAQQVRATGGFPRS